MERVKWGLVTDNPGGATVVRLWFEAELFVYRDRSFLFAAEIAFGRLYRDRLRTAHAQLHSGGYHPIQPSSRTAGEASAIGTTEIPLLSDRAGSLGGDLKYST